MMQRAFFSAFAAILVSAVLVQTAAAYPSTARTGTSTVTGTYRPLDLDLDTLVIGTNALNYTVGSGPFSFQVDLTGTFTGVGYTASGNAGTWRLFLSDLFDAGVTSSDVGNVITMSSGVGLQVGTLTYLGGLSVVTGALPLDGSDTPQIGDLFELFTTAAGSVLQVVCDDILTCNNFDLALTQNLAQVGPFVDTCGDACYELDDGTLADRPVNRVNPDGGVMTTLTASSIPEPATLALLGLGLAGLGLSRRARA